MTAAETGEKFKMRYLTVLIAMICIVAFSRANADIPTVLTDKVRQGDGLIDILTDVSGEELATYLDTGTLYLGVDVNEDASGLESSLSTGVAIKEMELVIQTTAGDFTFTEFYTNTTAMIQEAGTTEAQEFHTLFGSTGSNELTSSSSGFDISSFDDVVEIQNIEFEGEIISAQLRVSFLDTATAGDNEDFFDYSNGFEEFAILSSPDAALLDSAAIGISDSPTGLTYDVSAPSGTPEPPILLLLIIPGLILWKRRRR
jgi:hypothetical protein